MMKKLAIILAFTLITFRILSQTPQGISHQSIIRDADNQLVINTDIGIQVSLIQGAPDGTVIYSETHLPTSNANGLISFVIGQGSVVNGVFTNIDWADGLYFINTEADPAGGTNYTISGTSQVLSVPYALHAKTAESLTSGSLNIFYPGQDTLGGIVFFVFLDANGQQHGLIVSKTEGANLAWQIPSSLVGSNRTEDGLFNFNLMFNSPAKNWIVANFGSEWYLPSVDEISILWHNRFHVNHALRAAGLTLLSRNDVYWSSTEENADVAISFAFSSGRASDYYGNKSATYRVRAVQKF